MTLPSSVHVSCDSTAIAKDATPQAVTFTGYPANVPFPVKLTPVMACLLLRAVCALSKMDNQRNICTWCGGWRGRRNSVVPTPIVPPIVVINTCIGSYPVHIVHIWGNVRAHVFRHGSLVSRGKEITFHIKNGSGKQGRWSARSITSHR